MYLSALRQCESEQGLQQLALACTRQPRDPKYFSGMTGEIEGSPEIGSGHIAGRQHRALRFRVLHGFISVRDGLTDHLRHQFSDSDLV